MIKCRFDKQCVTKKCTEKCNFYKERIYICDMCGKEKALTELAINDEKQVCKECVDNF
jgi:hypothetical protein